MINLDINRCDALQRYILLDDSPGLVHRCSSNSFHSAEIPRKAKESISRPNGME